MYAHFRDGNFEYNFLYLLPEKNGVMSRKDQQTLLDVADGQEAVVKRFNDHHIASKLLAIGIIPDVKIKVVRRSPLGGALYLKLDDTFFAIRNQEAKNIIVE